MRRTVLLAMVAMLAGCGTVEREPALAPVRLELDAPADRATVEEDTVEVRGTVAPTGARVLVDGTPAAVVGGAFTVTVALEAGANVIDVQAGAPRRPAAMTAVRVTRVLPVIVPDLEGSSPDDAADALEDLGLRADVRYSGGLFDELLPVDETVCGTSPDAGTEVRAGSTVIVITAKSC